MGQMRSAVDVEARPDPIVVDPGATAIIVVDMQNDFAAPGGMFDRAGIPIDAIQAIVEPIRSSSPGRPPACVWSRHSGTRSIATTAACC